MPVVKLAIDKPQFSVLVVDLQDPEVQKICSYHRKSQEKIAYFLLNMGGVDADLTDDEAWILGAFIHYHVTCTQALGLKVEIRPDGHFDPDTGERLGLF